MNTSATDTLAYNIDLVNTWQADPSYYYNRELLTPDINIMEWLSRQIGKLLQELFGSRVMSEYGEIILIILVGSRKWGMICGMSSIYFRRISKRRMTVCLSYI